MGITSKRTHLLRGDSPRPVETAIGPSRTTQIAGKLPYRKRTVRAPIPLPTAGVDLYWAEFCELYLSRSPNDSGAFETAEKLFAHSCEPTRLADVTEATFERFAEALTRQGLPCREVQRRITNVRRGLKWGFDVGLIDPARFNVERRGDAWVWKLRKWSSAA